MEHYKREMFAEYPDVVDVEQLCEMLGENGELVTEAPKADESEVLFADYVRSWLKMIRPTVSAATYNSYRSMLDARIDRYFRELGVTLGALTPSQLQTFYQTILDDGNTTNTVIHYHAVLHRALKNAVKKDVIDRNPADRVDKPRKNRYQASHYTQEEMLRLFSVIEGDPLEPAIRIAAYYGLRKIRFHDLRHTAASLLLANGVPMKQIQIWLGHSTFSTTADIYAHLDVSAQRETGLVAASLYDAASGEACEGGACDRAEAREPRVSAS